MFDILSRLPVPALSRSRFVCKDWLTIIKDEAFIDMHHSRVSRYKSTFLMLCETLVYDTKLYSLSNDNPAAVNTCYHLTPKKTHKKVKLVGAANGLAFLSSLPNPYGYTEPDPDLDLESFYICNPLTREVLKLPEAMRHPKAIDFYDAWCDSPSAFAYDATSNTYKVIHTLPQQPDTHTTAVEIFVLGSKTWKRIPDLPTSLLTKTPVFSNGALHWETTFRGHGSEYSGCIDAIDVGAETFRAFRHPPPLFNKSNTSWRYLTLGDDSLPNTSLCTLGDDSLCWAYEDEIREQIQIWTMKEYGVEESWSKQYVIGRQMLGPLKGVPFQILTTPKNGTVLLLGGKDQGYYDQESKEFRQIQIQGIPQGTNNRCYKLYGFVHHGSLVSPRRIAAKTQRIECCCRPLGAYPNPNCSPTNIYKFRALRLFTAPTCKKHSRIHAS